MSRPPKESSEFLARWSRRKSDARREPEPEPETPSTAPAGPGPEKTEAEILEELGLPDPDTLGPGSDFKAFMAEAVPDWLRRKALRRLWTSNPVLANLDMLIDYGEDYTDKATVVVNLQSAYKAGRGYLDRVVESAPEEAPAASAPEAAAGTEGTAAPEPVTEAEAEGTAPAADAAPDAPPPEERPGEAPAEHAEAPDHAPEPPRTPPARRRRMRFEFGDG